MSKSKTDAPSNSGKSDIEKPSFMKSEAGYIFASVGTNDELAAIEVAATKRRASNQFTMREAAEIMANAYAEINASEFLRDQMKPAFRRGELTILDPDHGGEVLPSDGKGQGRECRDFRDIVTSNNMSAWRKKKLYPWPIDVDTVATAALPLPAQPPVPSGMQGWRLKARAPNARDTPIRDAVTDYLIKMRPQIQPTGLTIMSYWASLPPDHLPRGIQKVGMERHQLVGYRDSPSTTVKKFTARTIGAAIKDLTEPSK